MKTSLHPTTRPAAPPRRRAFSLIELLVVIAIIGILASFLLPVFARSKANAQNANCINQLRQLGIATRLYADDNDYRLPTAEALPSRPTLPQRPVLRISDVLLHYAGRATGAVNPSPLFKCPSDRSYFYEAEGSSYRWNTALNGQRIDLGETLHYFGGPVSNGGNWAPAATVNHQAVRTPLLLDYVAFHPRPPRSGKNVVYMDGHVAPFGQPN